MTAATADPAASTTSALTMKRGELLALDTRKKALQCEAEAIVSELTAEVPGGVSYLFLCHRIFAAVVSREQRKHICMMCLAKLFVFVMLS